MNKRITAADLNMAVDTMGERREKWKTEHPDEEMPVCPKCHNGGLIPRYFDEFRQEVFGLDARKPGIYIYYEPCECVMDSVSKLTRNNQKFASVPGLYIDATFDNFRFDVYQKIESRQLATSGRNDAMEYVAGFDEFRKAGIGLYIWSEARGSGKSRLASTISNELTSIGVRNKYASASGILSEIQRTWGDKTQNESKIIDNYIEPKVLIIDDFGARSGQSWIDERFQMIIEDRYAQNKVTVFTSNYEISNLPFKDMRIIDRLSDVDRFHVIRMPNETVRTKSRVINGDGSLFRQIVSQRKERGKNNAKLTEGR